MSEWIDVLDLNNIKPKPNLAGTAPPNPAVDDISLGYGVGSRWTDTVNNRDYVCTNPALGAATWVETTGTGVATTLDALTDTDLVGVADTNVLAYDLATTSWKPAAAGAGTVTSVDAGAGLVLNAGSTAAVPIIDIFAGDTTLTVTANSIVVGVIQTANIAFDAVGLPEMATGTPGGIISYTTTTGDPVDVGAGALNSVLTTTVVGSPPTWQATVTSLASLTDTDLVGVVDTNVLAYDLATTSWKPAIAGTVTGPGVSVIDNIATYTDTTGKTIKDSGVAVGDIALNTDHRGITAGNPHVVTTTEIGAIPIGDRGQPLGVAALDAAGLLPSSQLPISAMEFKGSWDASINTPPLVSSTGNTGDLYVVTVAGTTPLDGIVSWSVGDHVIFDGTVWIKVDHSATLGSTGDLSIVRSHQLIAFQAAVAATWYDIIFDAVPNIQNNVTVVEQTTTTTVTAHEAGLYSIEWTGSAEFPFSGNHFIRCTINNVVVEEQNMYGEQGLFMQGTDPSNFSFIVHRVLAAADVIRVQYFSDDPTLASRVLGKSALSVVRLSGPKGADGATGPQGLPGAVTSVDAGAGLVLNAGSTAAVPIIDVIGNTDNSIVVNSGDIQVGVLANDTQHGNLGGGTTHLAAIGIVPGPETAGFITGANQTKLDTIATGAVAQGLAGDNYATNHEADLTAHPASSIVNTPAGTITGPDVQTALNELDTNKAPVAHNQTLATITDSGTAAAINVGTGANQIVQLDGAAKLPAVDGSQLQNMPAASLHAIGGASHSTSPLSDINLKVSDQDIIGSLDSRLLTSDQAAGVAASATPITALNPVLSVNDAPSVGNAKTLVHQFFVFDPPTTDWARPRCNTLPGFVETDPPQTDLGPFSQIAYNQTFSSTGQPVGSLSTAISGMGRMDTGILIPLLSGGTVTAITLYGYSLGGAVTLSWSPYAITPGEVPRGLHSTYTNTVFASSQSTLHSTLLPNNGTIAYGDRIGLLIRANNTTYESLINIAYEITLP